MAKSQQTFNKKEKEKKRRKKKQDKLEKRQQRKEQRALEGKKSFEDLLMYVDEDGNLTKEKPDPLKKKKEIKVEDIVLGAAQRVDIPEEKIRKGKCKFFNDEKGYGFLIDAANQNSIFVHINNIQGDDIRENDKVEFEIEMGPKGPNAVNVKIIN